MLFFWGGVMHSFDAKLMLCIYHLLLLSSVDSIVDLRDSRIFEIIIIPIYAAIFSR